MNRFISDYVPSITQGLFTDSEPIYCYKYVINCIWLLLKGDEDEEDDDDEYHISKPDENDDSDEIMPVVGLPL